MSAHKCPHTNVRVNFAMCEDAAPKIGRSGLRHAALEGEQNQVGAAAHTEFAQ